VIGINLPNPDLVHPKESVQHAMRVGSVGKLLPGQAAQIRDPETGKLLSPYDRGILWLKGPNIFEGYLNEPEETMKVLRDGWFQTGRFAQFDEDGFLFVADKLKLEA
jgi:acyl-[acyl-carrier-protein]-phospholipid O-acyltransferase/long-chain-fatty-acid--[acyl-carrier-protein] ligase